MRHLVDSPREARQRHYVRLRDEQGVEFVNEVVAGVNAINRIRRNEMGDV